MFVLRACWAPWMCSVQFPSTLELFGQQASAVSSIWCIIISPAWASEGPTHLYIQPTSLLSLLGSVSTLLEDSGHLFSLSAESTVSVTSGFHDWSLHNRDCALVFLYMTSFWVHTWDLTPHSPNPATIRYCKVQGYFMCPCPAAAPQRSTQVPQYWHSNIYMIF